MNHGNNYMGMGSSSTATAFAGDHRSTDACCYLIIRKGRGQTMPKLPTDFFEPEVQDQWSEQLLLATVAIDGNLKTKMRPIALDRSAGEDWDKFYILELSIKDVDTRAAIAADPVDSEAIWSALKAVIVGSDYYLGAALEDCRYEKPSPSRSASSAPCIVM